MTGSNIADGPKNCISPSGSSPANHARRRGTVSDEKAMRLSPFILPTTSRATVE